MEPTPVFPQLGTPGQPWGAAEKAEWLLRQVRQRSYADEVVARIDALRSRFDVAEYGRLDYGGESFSLLAIRSRGWQDALPNILVTGGVHGYETSGVQGALQFVDRHAADYAGRVNLLVAPCVSPWAYERIHRWNPEAIDPNRSFVYSYGVFTQRVDRILHLPVEDRKPLVDEIRGLIDARDPEALDPDGLLSGWEDVLEPYEEGQ